MPCAPWATYEQSVAKLLHAYPEIKDVFLATDSPIVLAQAVKFKSARVVALSFDRTVLHQSRLLEQRLQDGAISAEVVRFNEPC